MPRPYKSQNLSINPTFFKNIKILRNLNYTSLHHNKQYTEMKLKQQSLNITSFGNM